MNVDRPNRVPEIRAALHDATELLSALGILGDGNARQRQANGWIIRCPIHNDRTPSLSVQETKDGILWKCWGCDAGGDAISLVAAVRGTSLRGPGFRDTLLECARMAGLWRIVDELEGRTPLDPETPAPRPVAATPARPDVPERSYPPKGELDALWGECGAVADDEAAAAYLGGRAIDPDAVDARGLARTLPARGALPPWARCARGDWREAGYRVVVPMYVPGGEMRSVRAWRVTDGDGPKRLPPSGCKASGLVMADEWAIAMLRETRAPSRVVVVEGESDFLTWGTRTSDPRTAVLGIVSGSWTAALAERFPVGARVVVRTDHDSAGNRYAADVIGGLKRRCFVFRSKEVTT